MFDPVSDAIPVRPLQLRLLGALLSVVVLTVVFGAGLHWVVPIVWVLFCAGVLAVVAVPTLLVSVDRAGLGALPLAFERFRTELIDVAATLYSLFPVPTDLPSPAFVLGVGTTLLVAQFAYTQRAVAVGVGDDGGTEVAVVRETVEGIVTRLAAQADVPAPSVRVVEEQIPRTFAVGRVGTGSVVVTTGLLDALDEDELEGVLAHEVAHFANDDVAYMTFLAFLPLLEDDSIPIFERLLVAGGHLLLYVRDVAVEVLPDPIAGVLAEAHDGFAWLGAKLNKAGRLLAALFLGFVVFDSYLDFGITRIAYSVYAASGLSPVWAGVVVFAILSVLLLRAGYPLFFLAPAWLFARVVAVAFSRVTGPLAAQFSRDREFAADRAGARLTGNPGALASALATLDPEAVAQSTDLREHTGLAALSVFPYVTEAGGAWERITDHPPSADRIDRLQELAKEY